MDCMILSRPVRVSKATYSSLLFAHGLGQQNTPKPKPGILYYLLLYSVAQPTVSPKPKPGMLHYLLLYSIAQTTVSPKPKPGMIQYLLLY